MSTFERGAIPLSSEPPLRQLWGHARRHRPKVVLATFFSILNKIFDLAPPGLIGTAVDVVVHLGRDREGRRRRGAAARRRLDTTPRRGPSV